MRESDVERLKAVDTFWYIASPYSKYEQGLDAACRDVCRITAELVKRGIPCFSPIAHTHPIAIHSGMDPLAHDIWLPADEPMMRSAHGIIIAKMTGWLESYGVNYEIDYFLASNKPVLFIDPERGELEC